MLKNKPLLVSGIFVVIVATILLLQPNSIYYEYVPGVSTDSFSKSGLAWATTHCGDQVVLEAVSGSYHRWSPEYNTCPNQPEFIPLWRPSNSHEWTFPIDYSRYALFLNEPDGTIPDGDALTSLQSAQKYIEFKSICPNCRIIALNLARGDNTSYATAWRNHVNQLTGSYPIVEGYGIHAYGTRIQIINQIQSFRNWMVANGESNKQLWLTEFGGAYASNRTQLSANELQLLLNQLDDWDYLNRYFWFPTRWYKPGDCSTNCPPNVFFIGNTQLLTPLGTVYSNGSNGYP